MECATAEYTVTAAASATPGTLAATAMSVSVARFLDSSGFPGGSDDKESTLNAGDLGFIPGSGGSPGEGNGYPLQYSCLENSLDRRTWGAIVHGVAKNRTSLND